MAPLRLYLTGRMAIECGPRLLGERDLAGRQGRLAFAFLALNRHRPVARRELADVLWPDGPSREPEVALNAILSRLRGTLRQAAPDAPATIEAISGTVALRLPPGAGVDVEQATNAIDEAEGRMRGGDPGGAWGHANVAVAVARRPFLPDEDAPWIETERRRLRQILTRGLDCLSRLSERHGDAALAAQYAGEAIELEPFRETAYQHLMRVHVRAGNRAEALRVFARCRDLLRDELGASPSPETEQLHLAILRGEA